MTNQNDVTLSPGSGPPACNAGLHNRLQAERSLGPSALNQPRHEVLHLIRYEISLTGEIIIQPRRDLSR
jgi:hypothetical protein